MGASVRRSAFPLGIVILSMTLVVTVLGYPQAHGAEPIPSVRLVASDNAVTLEHADGEPVPMDLGTYIASVGGAFELQVLRTTAGFKVIQVVRTPRGIKVVRTLPADVVSEDSVGLKGFFRITARKPGGARVASTTASFCPSWWGQARVDDSGPDAPTYPSESGCWIRPTAHALVWGIDTGWAVQSSDAWSTTLDLEDGTYDVTIAITKRYRSVFQIPAADASATITALVTTWTWEPPPWEDPRPLGAESQNPGTQATGHHNGEMPAVQEDASGLPDLAALPSSEAWIENNDGRDSLTFAATIWNAGPGPMVVEGFRRPGQATMDAYQSFYADGQKTGRKLVGTMEYDARDGHQHWHFTDFARYQLLSKDGKKIERSQKEAFCLAPTDPVDMTLPTSNWRPSWIGLSTSCGGPRAIWIREVLDVGWGDTYYQSLPGQSFDVTDLPNGTYQIEVVTNPDGRLLERTASNNRAVRVIKLGGTPGDRTVTLK